MRPVYKLLGFAVVLAVVYAAAYVVGMHVPPQW